jgi:hypothetical protein
MVSRRVLLQFIKILYTILLKNYGGARVSPSPQELVELLTHLAITSFMSQRQILCSQCSHEYHEECYYTSYK